jgi:hypothetical protein
MGKFSDKKHEEANDALLNAVNSDSKFDSVKEILTMLAGEDGKKTFSQLVALEITSALGENGAITTAISGAITAALGSEGAITSAISSAITAGIGEGGAIETWADGRYEAKASNG